MYYFIKLKPSMKRLASPSKSKHNSINRTYRLLRMIMPETILSTDICIDKLTLAFCPKHTHTHFIRRGWRYNWLWSMVFIDLCISNWMTFSYTAIHFPELVAYYVISYQWLLLLQLFFMLFKLDSASTVNIYERY